MPNLLCTPPLSLYIHIPWCVKKCPYCDFNSHAQHGALPEKEYIAALLADLDTELADLENPIIHSIFFGGGTPSLFSADAMSSLLAEIKQRVTFSSDIEITLEANPGTTEQGKFDGFREAGINRLSIGIQSFHNAHLTQLGRIHNSGEAINAVATAKAAGFTNFNVDLMHGLPDQRAEQALEDLQQAIELQPSHLSWYQLTVEPNTVFYNTQPTLPDEDILESIEQRGLILLNKAGFGRYEISAYCQTKKQSKHNLNYWQFGDYIGIGAGAHGKITNPTTGAITRRWKTRQPNDYMSKPPLAGEKHISQQELPLEFLMNALRLTNGVNEQLFEQHTGINLEEIAEPRQKLVDKGLLANGNRIATTRLGMRFLDSVLQQFQT